MGYVRDARGRLINEVEAANMGYGSKRSRYGGRVVNNPDDYLEMGGVGYPDT